MRINKIADDEEPLALWKLVNDSVWAAIQTQLHQQAQQRAAQQQQKKPNAHVNVQCLRQHLLLN